MKTMFNAVRDWVSEVAAAWNSFWFTPAEPYTLAAIRVLGGLMLFYTHLIWSLDLLSFLGPNSWVTRDVSPLLSTQWLPAATGELTPSLYAWSYFWYVDAPAIVWTLHIAALVVFAMFTLGLFSRVTAVLAWWITLSYCHRLQGALFGLDQVNAMLAMYLMIGPSGAAYSLDRLWRRRRLGSALPAPPPSVGANIAIRLIQVHLAIIYLFGGIDKLRGDTWWDGSAFWFGIASYEYQSLDITWLIHYRPLIAALTHITVFWETFYGVLIWPRLTRPIMLTLAVAVHGGIALFLGMPTFGLAMLIGNLAFISPTTVQWVASGNFFRRSENPAKLAANSARRWPATAKIVSRPAVRR